MSDSVIMFIGQIFNGLKIGSVYSLVALGYTLSLIHISEPTRH